MNTVQSIIIAIVEGLTEFLPISSTGHMIITEKLLQIDQTDFSKVFTVAIQFGAILAVLAVYSRKFLDLVSFDFYIKLTLGVIPALVFGFLFSNKIDALLESSLTVAITLLVGGIILLFVEKLFKAPTIKGEEDVTFGQATIIGFWQCIAMVPGVSRSAASIIGGMQQKLTRSAAAEFSFFLAVPTMLAATVYKMYKYYKEAGGFSTEELQQLAVGNVVAFVVALMAIKFFINFLKKFGFRIWGLYRIVVGCILLYLIHEKIIS